MKRVSHHFVVRSVTVVEELHLVVVADADDTTMIETDLVGEDAVIGRNPNSKRSATTVEWQTTMPTCATS